MFKELKSNRDEHSIEAMRYSHTINMYEGIIVEINGVDVTIDIKGRLGQMVLPIDMIIPKAKSPLLIGQEVGFILSYPEILL